tara:strand:+ start:247 stop:669 length:423 start_codon:yes stop_codon:yes gene_type:complete
MTEFTVVTSDDLHMKIFSYIKDNSITIGEYEDMKETVLTMIQKGYMFNMDRDRLRDAMEDITFVMNPGDVVNKDRVSRGLEYDEDSDSDEETDDLVSMLIQEREKKISQCRENEVAPEEVAPEEVAPEEVAPEEVSSGEN